MIRPVGLFRMPERAAAAMIDADPGGGHDKRDVEGRRRPVKQANVICRVIAAGPGRPAGHRGSNNPLDRNGRTDHV